MFRLTICLVVLINSVVCFESYSENLDINHLPGNKVCVNYLFDILNFTVVNTTCLEGITTTKYVLTFDFLKTGVHFLDFSD